MTRRVTRILTAVVGVLFWICLVGHVWVVVDFARKREYALAALFVVSAIVMTWRTYRFRTMQSRIRAK